MMSMGSLFGDDDDEYVDIDSKIEGNTVECPLCGKKISEAQANSHIDECLNLVAINELQDINKVPIAPPVVSKQPIEPPKQKIISHGKLFRDLYSTSSDDDDSNDDSESDEEKKITLANLDFYEGVKKQISECLNSANPYHECSQYCKDRYQNYNIEKKLIEKKDEIKIGHQKERKEEKEVKEEVVLRLIECPNIVNPYHVCSNYCKERYQNLNNNKNNNNNNNNNNVDVDDSKKNDKLLDEILDEAMKECLKDLPPKKIDKSGDDDEESVDILPLFSDVIDKKESESEDSDDSDDDDDKVLKSKTDIKKSGELLKFVRKLLEKKLSIEEISPNNNEKKENSFKDNNNNNNNDININNINNNNDEEIDNNYKKIEGLAIPIPPPAPPVILKKSNNEPINDEDQDPNYDRYSLENFFNEEKKEKNDYGFNPVDFSYNYSQNYYPYKSPNPSSSPSSPSSLYSSSSYSSYPSSSYSSYYNKYKSAEDNNKNNELNYAQYIDANDQQNNENENPFSVLCPYSVDCKRMEAKEFPSHVIENHMDFFSHAFPCPICLLVDDSVAEEFNIAIQQNTMNLLNHLFEFHPEMLNFDEQSNEQQNQIPVEPPPVQIPTKIGDSIVEQTLTTRMEKECQICFETFEVGSKVAWMECFCVFHSHCITSWNDVKSQKAHCPVHSE